MKFIHASFLALALVAPSTIAAVISEPRFPPIPRDLPEGTKRLAVDDSNGDIIAYSAAGVKLGVVPAANSSRQTAERRDDKSGDNPCKALSTDELKGCMYIDCCSLSRY
jgi:hypothetical protein